MRTAYLIAFLVCGLVAANSALAREPAARLKQAVGSVLINTGETYKSVAEGMELYKGDRLMTMEKSSMVVEHNDGCISEYEEQQIVTVTEVSTCANGVAYVEHQWPREADPVFQETRRTAPGAYGYNYGYEGPADYSKVYTIGGVALLGGLVYYAVQDSDSVSAQ